jgi:acyl dehydratase
MTHTVSMNFATPPSLWCALPKMLLARRPSHVPEGRSCPHIEARIKGLSARSNNLEAYRRVCGFAADGKLPITYPHVMTTPLHMAVLTSDAFPIRLLGLVHVRNEIISHRPIGQDEALDVLCSLPAHRETDRGQEFDFSTTANVGGTEVWSETSTFLARRRSDRGGGSARSAPKPPGDETPAAVQTTSWHADADIGRRYASVSGDYNLIHISDLTARLFGFQRAIAHGLWSLARTAAELRPRLASDGVKLSAEFKLPILLPAWVTLQSWTSDSGIAFALKDAQGEKPHITGSLSRL